MIDSGDRERGPVWTCDNGHAISPGDEFCGRCGVYVRPGGLSGPPAAAQPGREPGQEQAGQATEYAGDPSGEYAPLFSSGSFTEFIAATSEADISPFLGGPFPDEAIPDPYQPPAAAVPGSGAPGPGAGDPGAPAADAHDEPVALDDGAPDVRVYGTWDDPGRMVPGTSGHDDPANPDSATPDSATPDSATPDAAGAGDPAGPDGGQAAAYPPGQPASPGVVPGDSRGRGPGSPDSAAAARYARDEPEAPGRDQPGDGLDTPVSGFHAMLRGPADPPPAPPPPSVTPGRGLIPPVEWGRRPARITSPAEERIAPPGEWHLPARPAPAASGTSRPSGILSSGPASSGPASGAAAANGREAHGTGGAGTGGIMTDARTEDGDDDGPDTAVGPTLPADPLAGGGYRRPSRTRLLAGAAVVAILGVTGVTGTLVVMHSHQGGVPAATSAPTGGVSTHAGGGASARPAGPAARWSSPAPVDPQTLQASSSQITGLACPKSTVCYATDSGGTVLSLQSGGTWPVANTDPNGRLIAISCPSARSCLTVDAAGYATPLSHGTWGTPALVGSGSGTLTSVSCAYASFCVAVNNIGVAFTYRGASAGWTQQTVDPSGQSLNSVSCPSSTYCVAVSASGNLFTYDGTSWSGADAVDTGHDLVSVSCPTTSFCMAVDSSGQAAEHSDGLWGLQPLGSAAAAVSCPSAGSCLAVGPSGAATSYANGLWTRVPAAAPGAKITTLSCATATACVATDEANNVLFYAPPQSG